MKRLLYLVIAVAAAYAATQPHGLSLPGLATRPAGADAVIEQAFAERRGDLQVQGEGVVERVLADDRDGSRHQRFILRLGNGRTVLVAHNIDLAPRIDALRAGDRIAFNGEYEWNAKGGVIHWTHHDPAGRHVAGWLRHAGRTYQ